ncbi:HAD hydrolase-like protein [Pedobacter sp. PAMC26386]|nr:HAD hydrolase-like protein [Pedobacter sp. PAMC26386]
MKKFEAVIYDLDDTIFPTKTIHKEVVKPVLDAIVKYNEGTLSEASLSDALSDCYKHSLRDVAVMYGFTRKMYEKALKAFSYLKIDYQLRTYPDYTCIGQIPGLRLLVTSGYTSFQNLKISNLGIAQDFEEIFIHDNEKSSFLGKVEIFRHIQEKYNLASEDVLVIGDNPISEIAAGNELKMNTVQILREGVIKNESAKNHIQNFHELIPDHKNTN